MNLICQMSRVVLVLALVLAASVVLAAESASTQIEIKSVKVTLPSIADQFPPGPGSELAGQCLICHSASMVLTQPALTPETWKAEINKMRKAYGAPIAEADVDALSIYLARVNADQQTR